MSQNEKPKKIPRAIIYREIAYAINGEPTKIGHLAKNFVCIERDNKRIAYIKNDDDVLRLSSLQEVADCIQQFCQNGRLADNESYALLPKDCMECAKLWLSTAPIIDEHFIKMVRFKDEPGYCFRRLPWVFDPNLETPTFDELMGRISNSDALKLWIGALFEPKAYRQQYVYLYGPGKSGKGSLGYFLFKALDTAAQLLDTNIGYAHWTTGILDKRFGFFDDVDFQIVGWGKFRALTGGPKMSVNIKYGHQFTAQNNCMFLFTSNNEPEFSGEDEDMRRVILCKSQKPTDKSHSEYSYEKALWDEGGAFLSQCIAQYQRAYGENYGAIECDNDRARQIARDLEWQFAYVAEHLHKRPGQKTSSLDFRQGVYKITRACEFKWSDKHYGKFKKYCEREKICSWVEDSERRLWVHGVGIDGYPSVKILGSAQKTTANTVVLSHWQK